MLIDESPVIEFLAVEIEAPNGGFLMGINRFGDAFGDGTEAIAWQPYTPKVKLATITRGGTQNGPTNTIAVGTLMLELINSADPLEDYNVRPGVRIRLNSTVDTPTELFTGEISDVNVVYNKNKTTGVITKRISIVAVDAVQSLGDTKRYGADDGVLGYEKWEERIERLCESTDVDVVLPTEDTPASKYAYNYVDFDATPSGDGLDYWTRFGTYPSGVTGTIDQAAVSGIFPGQTVGVNVQSSNGFVFPKTLAADTYGAKRTVSGLTVGKEYTLRMGLAYHDPTAIYPLGSVASGEHFSRYKIGVVGIGYGSEVDLRTGSVSGDKYLNTMPDYTFTATSTSHEIAYILSTGNTRSGASTNPILETVIGYNVQLETAPSVSDYRLASIVYESNLVNHLDIACDSVGAYWWVDQTNTVQFKADLDVDGSILTFSDTPETGQLGYTDYNVTYDTRNTVNDLTILNHGQIEDPENPGNYLANDLTFGYINETSRAGYRPRTADLEISLYNEDAYSGSVDQRAAEILSDYRRPKKTIRSIRWNAQESKDKLALLDIYSEITVNADGNTQPSRIVGLTYTIEPTRIMVDLVLTVERGQQLTPIE